jgi:hypothetical protein
MEDIPIKPLTEFRKNKEAQDRWRKKNQEKINQYYRERKAELRRIKKDAEDKIVIKEFLQKQLSQTC